MTPRTMLVGAIAIAASLAPLSAQTIHVVSATGGGQFVDIQAAITAARIGDTIVVQAGQYNGFTVNKGLRILGGPGVQLGFFQGPIIIEQVPAGQTVTMREIDPGISIGPSGVVIRDCVGLVQVENQNITKGISVERCQQVSLHGSTVIGDPGLWLDSSTVLITQCNISSSSFGAASPGIASRNSNVTFAEGTVRGGVVYHGFGPPEVGIRVTGGRFTVAGDSQTQVSVAPFPRGGGQLPAIQASGATIVVDPAVTLIPQPGSPAIGLSAGATSSMQPTASLHSTVTGRQLTLRLHATGATAAFTVFGFPQTPSFFVPGFGELWMSAIHVLIDAGAVLPTGVRSATVTLPWLPLGREAALQSVILRPGNVIELSTPILRTFV